MKYLRIVFHLFAIAVLTILTQIGGVCYGMALVVSPKIRFIPKGKLIITFLCMYFISTYLIVPPIAKITGRVPIRHHTHIFPVHFTSQLLNRNYVTPALNEVLQQIAKDLENSPITLQYMDASFPFVDGFPLLPHLSHNDGKKIDIGLIYKDTNGNMLTKQKSRTGYGVFTSPLKHESNTVKQCHSTGSFYYSMARYFTLGTIHPELQLSEEGTAQLIKTIVRQDDIQKVFLEPNLVQRLALQHPKIRFHGCHAVRHDDHIHLQIQ